MNYKTEGQTGKQPGTRDLLVIASMKSAAKRGRPCGLHGHGFSNGVGEGGDSGQLKVV